MAVDVGCHHRDIALRGVGRIRAVGVADGAQGQLVIIGWQVAAQGNGVGAAATHRQTGDAVPVGAVARGHRQGFTASVAHIADVHHHLAQVAVLVCDGGVGRCNLDGRAAFGVGGGVAQAIGHAIGIHRGCPDVADGASGAHSGWRAAGRAAVGNRHRHRARTRIRVRVGVLVGNGFDDVLVLCRRAGAADADAGRAAAGDDDASRVAAVGQRFIGGAKQVVGGAGGNRHGGRGHRVCNGANAGGVHIRNRHVAVDNGNRRAAHQKVLAVAVQVQHRRVVDIAHHQRGSVREQRIRCGVAARSHVHLGCVRGAVGAVPQVVVQRAQGAVDGIGNEAQLVGG